jgi:hypothetical protein
MKHYTVLLLTVVLLALLALAGGAAAEPMAVDAFTNLIPGEPNDTFATAIPLTLSEFGAEGYFLTAADIDFYRADLPTAARVYFDLQARYGGEPMVRAELAVYDSAQTLIAQDITCDGAADLAVDVPAGPLYLRVRPCAGALDIDTPYALSVTPYPREWEPNNTRPTASWLFVDGGTVNCDYCHTDAAIEPAGDVDFHRFEGQAGRWVTLEAYTNELGLELALLAADGSTLATGVNGYDGRIVFQLPADATYYLRLRSATHPTGTSVYTLAFWRGHDAGDAEPNDTPAQAVPTAYGAKMYGDTSDTDPVDYYRFDGQAGDTVAIPGIEYGYRDFQVALFGPTLNAIPLNAPSNWASLPTTGAYYVAITGAEWDPTYGAQIVLLTGDEPNDTMGMATDVGQAATLVVTRDYDCDTDWIRFQGRAGDVLTGVNNTTAYNDVKIYAADGTLVSSVLPTDGVYYLHFLDEVHSANDGFCMFADSYPLTFREALWVSAAVDGLGGNAAIKRGDIATRKTAAGQWQIVFDASDVGITADLAAFERMPNGSILMSLGTAQNVPGLGKVMPQDIIRFVPTALGDTTAGAFEWFLDGSDVGLSTTGEKIDAISMQRDIQQPLRISITGAGSVPRQSGGNLKVADEDVFNYVGTFGANSVGKWRGTPNSVVPGMAKEDVSGMTRVELIPQSNSLTLYSFDSAFTIGGQSGGPFDVLVADAWRLAVQALTDKKLDGLAIGPAWTP